MPSDTKSENFEFAVGETYSNRQRQYTVLGIQGTKLLVRFDDGSTGTLVKRLGSHYQPQSGNH